MYAVQGRSRAAEYLESHPELLLHNATGMPAVGWGGLHIYDHSQAKVRELWKDNCLALTASGVVDGCGADFSVKGAPPGVDPAKAAAWGEGHMKMMRDTTAALGPNGLLVGKNFDQVRFYRPGVLEIKYM